MVTSKKDQNNQEIKQKLTRRNPYEIYTGKGNEHLPALIPLRRGLVRDFELKKYCLRAKEFVTKVSDSFHTPTSPTYLVQGYQSELDETKWL